LPHPEIIDYQCQVLINTVEVFELRSHLVGLLVEFLDLNLSGSNVAFEFLDLVVEDELELFEFLSLLLELKYPIVFFLNGGFSLLDLLFLCLNLLTKGRYRLDLFC
jgi:hypothetical protein